MERDWGRIAGGWGEQEMRKARFFYSDFAEERVQLNVLHVLGVRATGEEGGGGDGL